MLFLDRFTTNTVRSTCVNFPTWIERKRAGNPNMMDVKLRKPQMARVMIERMRKLFGGGYWLGIVAPRGAVTSSCIGDDLYYKGQVA